MQKPWRKPEPATHTATTAVPQRSVHGPPQRIRWTLESRPPLWVNPLTNRRGDDGADLREVWVCLWCLQRRLCRRERRERVNVKVW
uniref:Uncharacterized protein n=1 Tax=Knipowitschia caucasica TaxID=637954 RepID=A0AAV2LUL5_KNICA